MTTVEIGLLGPLELRSGGEEVPVTGRQARIIVALLAVECGKAVTTDSIIDAVWPEDPPERARKTVQVYVANLRKALGGESSPIMSVPNGYSLANDRATVDTAEFERLLERAGGAASDQDAIDTLSEATGLWRGEPFAEFDIDVLRGEAVRLEESRLAALERRAELELRCGRHAETIAELDALTRDHPYRERLRSLHMLALYRSGRQADALRVYERTRSLLADELGLDPTPELQRLEQQILEQSPVLDLDPNVGNQGVQTFLVTDLVDSTALWEADPDAMSRSLARHDAILEAAIEQQDGYIFKGTGDGVLAVLPSADAAAAAATTAQLALADEQWVGPALTVRMAIDTGQAEERDGDFYGPALNRASRLMASAHGGQVVLTDDAAATTAAAPLMPLGAHDYKGVGRIDVLQLDIVDGGQDFPPLRIDRPGMTISRTGFDHSIRGYELRERLGEGDFGIVYRAYQASVGREVAIKVIRPEFASRPTFIRRFEVEAQLVAQVEHPHVVSLYDYWRDPDGAYLVMPWIRAGNLASALARGPLNGPAAFKMLDQVGSALAAAHRQGVVHCDIKPANVLLDDDGNAYLSDFGIASRHVDSTGWPMSTSPSYLSPEQIAGQPSSTASDIYALGMLAFETLTATRPPDDTALPSLTELRPELSPSVDAAIRRATADDAAERFDRTEDFLRALRQAFGTDVVSGGEVDRRPDESLRNPYRGLQAFQETDAEEFFGRDALIDELVDAVDRHPLVAAIGPSGSGKSSAVRAGLLPRLRTAPDQRWFITDMFPGSFPLEELERALLRVATSPLDDLREELLGDELGLTRAIKSILPDDGSRLLLVIDQFEELFSLTTDESARDLFIASLGAAARESRGRLTVLVTMRADFFHRPLEYGDFGHLLKDGLVPVSMPTSDSLALAVSQPARRAGLDIEPGLVNEIVRDVVDEPGGLPLMQHALSELFQRRQGRTLTIQAYRESGGVTGALTRRADEIHRGLSGAGRSTARQIFLRLVRADEVADDTRRRVRLSELHALGLDRGAVDEVLHEFGQFRLLTFDRDVVTRSPTVEVGHEALIREWPTLRGWIDDRRQDLLLERRLELATDEWTASDRDTEFLLQGARLQQFSDWAQTTDVSLTADERSFLSDSADHDAATTAAASRRRRVLTGVLAILALVASTLAVFAFAQRNDARDASELAAVEAERANEASALAIEEAARANEAAALAAEREQAAALRAAEARAGQLAGLANATAESDPEIAIHLALEADATAAEFDLQLPEVASALLSSSFADRLRGQLPAGPQRSGFFVPHGVSAIDSSASIGTIAQAELDPFGLFPTAFDVLDLETGEALHTIEDDAGLSWMMFDPVTGELLSLSFDGTFTWYDPETMDVDRTLQVEGPALLPDRVGDLISYGVITNQAEFDLETRVIDVTTGERIFTGPPDAFVARLSADGSLVAVQDDGVFIRVFDVQTGEPLAVLTTPPSSAFSFTWVSAHELAIVSETGTAKRVDARTGAVLSERVIGSYAAALANPTGELIAVTGIANTTAIYDAQNFDELLELPRSDAQIDGIGWAADSRTLVTSHLDGITKIWDLGERHTAAVSHPELTSESFIEFEFAADDLVVMAGIAGVGEVRRLDADRTVIADFPLPARGFGDGPIATTDGRVVAMATADAAIGFYDAQTGERLATSELEYDPLAAHPTRSEIVVSSTGPSFGSGDPEGYAVVDATSGELVWSLEHPDTSFELVEGSGAIFAPSGDLIAFETSIPGDADIENAALGGLDTDQATTNIVVRDGDTYEARSTTAYDNAAVDVAVSPDGQLLGVLDHNNIARLYDLSGIETAEPLPLIGQTVAGPFAIAFSSDSRLLLIGEEGAITARSADAELALVWQVGIDEWLPTELVVDDGIVWTNYQERIAHGSDRKLGLVGFPLDAEGRLDYARSQLDNELTEAQCQRFLGLDSCDQRLAAPLD